MQKANMSLILRRKSNFHNIQNTTQNIKGVKRHGIDIAFVSVTPES